MPSRGGSTARWGRQCGAGNLKSEAPDSLDRCGKSVRSYEATIGFLVGTRRNWPFPTDLRSLPQTQETRNVKTPHVELSRSHQPEPPRPTGGRLERQVPLDEMTTPHYPHRPTDGANRAYPCPRTSARRPAATHKDLRRDRRLLIYIKLARTRTNAPSEYNPPLGAVKQVPDHWLIKV